MKKTAFYALCGLLLATTSLQSQAQQTLQCIVNDNIPLSHQLNDFVFNDTAGTVDHLTTGLTWKRCFAGQTWKSTTPRYCEGTAIQSNWGAALQNASTGVNAGWRLPSAAEIATIIEPGCQHAAFNQMVISGSVPYDALYWTSTPSNAANSTQSGSSAFGLTRRGSLYLLPKLTPGVALMVKDTPQ